MCTGLKRIIRETGKRNTTEQWLLPYQGIIPVIRLTLKCILLRERTLLFLKPPYISKRATLNNPSKRKQNHKSKEMVKGTETKMASFHLQTEIQIPLQTR
jgi:hypothetical protein